MKALLFALAIFLVLAQVMAAEESEMAHGWGGGWGGRGGWGGGGWGGRGGWGRGWKHTSEVSNE
jgi:Spy/CpxP family protein refolding chaperone